MINFYYESAKYGITNVSHSPSQEIINSNIDK